MTGAPEDVAAMVEASRKGPIGAYVFSRSPSHLVWVPIMQYDRVVAGIVAMRNDGGRFQATHLKLRCRTVLIFIITRHFVILQRRQLWL